MKTDHLHSTQPDAREYAAKQLFKVKDYLEGRLHQLADQEDHLTLTFQDLREVMAMERVLEDAQRYITALLCDVLEVGADGTAEPPQEATGEVTSTLGTDARTDVEL